MGPARTAGVVRGHEPRGPLRGRVLGELEPGAQGLADALQLHPGDRGPHRTRPVGSWSDATVLLSADRDGAPCRLLMTKEGCGAQERYHDRNKAVPGGLYAPFVMERYTTSIATFFPASRQADIYWLVSTWNPYQVAVMRSTLSVWDTRIPTSDPPCSDRSRSTIRRPSSSRSSPSTTTARSRSPGRSGPGPGILPSPDPSRFQQGGNTDRRRLLSGG